MLPFRNNPVHSNSNLLYDDSNRTSTRFRCTPPTYSSSSGRPPLSAVGEDASSCIPSESFAFPGYVAVDRNLQGSLPILHDAMDFIPLDFFSYALPDPSPRTLQQAVSYNTVAAGFGGYLPCSSIPGALPTDEFLDPSSWSFPHDLITAQQPPSMPPTVPEDGLPSHPPFGYHQCGWLSGPGCDGIAPGKNREMAEHLRVFHNFVGHERDVVTCEWENCGQIMQRMNVPRHIVSRHLLEAANCRICRKRFSRPDVVARHEKTCGARPVAGTSSGSRKPLKLAGRSCDF